MANKSNRIEVDLQIMQEEQLAKLEKFGKDFNNTVDRLVKITDKMGGVVSGTTPPTGPAGQVSPTASTAAATDTMIRQQVTPARQGGQPEVPGWASSQGTLLNAPAAPGGGGGGPSTPQQTDQSFEDQFIELQRRIGTSETAIPASLRQALGYYAEGQLNTNPFEPFLKGGDKGWQAELASINADPNITNKGLARRQMWARRANDMLFNIESSKALAMRGMGKYANFWGGIQNVTDAGYATAPNTGTGGRLGSSLFSGSFFHGLGESVWAPMISSTFGLNPGYSLGQAQQARQAINQYGWSSGNMGNWLSGVLKENTIRYRLDPQTQMSFLDPMLRFGGWQSFDQLEATLRSLPSAAQAAGMNVKQFTAELVQASQQVALQTGNTPGTVAGVLQNFSATTGLAPQQGA